MRADPHGDLCNEVSRVLGKPLTAGQISTVRQLLTDFGRLRRFRFAARFAEVSSRHEATAERLAKQCQLNVWYLFRDVPHVVTDGDLEFRVSVERRGKLSTLAVSDDYFRPLPKPPMPLRKRARR